MILANSRHRARWLLVHLMLTCSISYARGWVPEMQPDNPDAKLCRVLQKRLNDFPESCVRTALESYAQFSAPPWKTIDTRQYFGLLTQLIAYKNGFPEKAVTDFTPFQTRARDFMSHGGRMRVWRTHLISNFGNGAREDEAPQGKQTIVQLVEQIEPQTSTDKCAGTDNIQIVTYTFLVTPDLTSIDKKMKAPMERNLLSMNPVLYEGRTLLIKSTVSYVDAGHLWDGGSVTIWQNLDHTGLHHACSFRFDGNDHDNRKDK